MVLVEDAVVVEDAADVGAGTFMSRNLAITAVRRFTPVKRRISNRA